MKFKWKKKLPYLTAMLMIIVLLLPLIMYCYNFRELDLSSSTTDWGTFGDYIGGSIGSVITLIGFIYIYKTYKSQVANYYISGFENTFFKMIEFHHKIIDGLQFTLKGSESTGRKALYNYALHIVRYYNDLFSSTPNNDQYFDIIKNEIIAKYSSLYENFVFQIGHYFRHLYHIFKFINESNLSVDDKMKYAKILRAQLSTEELLLVGINGMTEYGIKFKSLIEDYSLLHRLMNFNAYRALFISFYESKAFGDEDIFNTLPENDEKMMIFYEILKRIKVS